MTEKLRVGDEAPDFDLTSTEDAVLMLRDEVPRTAVILYLFPDPGDAEARATLELLAGAVKTLAALRARVIGISSGKLPELKKTQIELGLPFPLLFDDRGFLAAYGVSAEGEEAPPPALVAVDRQQRVAWLGNPAPDIEAGLAEIQAVLVAAPSSTSNYPGRIVNRFVDRRIN